MGWGWREREEQQGRDLIGFTTWETQEDSSQISDGHGAIRSHQNHGEKVYINGTEIIHKLA